MDLVGNAKKAGVLGILLENYKDDDVSAWIVYNTLPSPEIYSKNLKKQYFSIESLDRMLGGISGL